MTTFRSGQVNKNCPLLIEIDKKSLNIQDFEYITFIEENSSCVAAANAYHGQTDITGRERLDKIQKILGERGKRLVSVSLNNIYKLPHTDTHFHDCVDFLEAYLNRCFERSFMIEDDDKGWLKALESAWNLADKTGRVDLSKKLEEILEYLRKGVK